MSLRERNRTPCALELVSEEQEIVDLAVVRDPEPPVEARIGWWPAGLRSWMASRRETRPTGPSRWMPVSSGPRWARIALIRSRSSGLDRARRIAEDLARDAAHAMEPPEPEADRCGDPRIGGRGCPSSCEAARVPLSKAHGRRRERQPSSRGFPSTPPGRHPARPGDRHARDHPRDHQTLTHAGPTRTAKSPRDASRLGRRPKPVHRSAAAARASASVTHRIVAHRRPRPECLEPASIHILPEVLKRTEVTRPGRTQIHVLSAI